MKGYVIGAVCRSGKRRWFWIVTHDLDRPRGQNVDHCGYAETADEARDEARDKVAPRVVLWHSNAIAEDHLRWLNREARKRRPPKTGTREGVRIEYLFHTHKRRILSKYRIIKWTKRSIFYEKNDGQLGGKASFDPDDVRVGRLAKAELGEDRWGYCWSVNEPAFFVKGEMPDLKALRNAMVDSHPDKGGSHEAFIAAHNLYEAAKKHAKQERRARA
jgi:hypothetical protein